MRRNGAAVHMECGMPALVSAKCQANDLTPSSPLPTLDPLRDGVGTGQHARRSFCMFGKEVGHRRGSRRTGRIRHAVLAALLAMGGTVLVTGPALGHRCP